MNNLPASIASTPAAPTADTTANRTLDQDMQRNPINAAMPVQEPQPQTSFESDHPQAQPHQLQTMILGLAARGGMYDSVHADPDFEQNQQQRQEQNQRQQQDHGSHRGARRNKRNNRFNPR